LFLALKLHGAASEYFMIYYNKAKEDSREERRKKSGSIVGSRLGHIAP
jgi:hypothetical protein